MQLNHYLNFQGQTEAAFNFYRSVFGGEFAMLSRYVDIPPQDGVTLSDLEKNYILHVSLPINDFTILMGSDTTEHFCAQSCIPLPKALIIIFRLILIKVNKMRRIDYFQHCPKTDK